MAAVKHLHWLFIAGYLLLFLAKSGLFLSGARESFESFRKRTLIIENVFAAGFLVTGLLMLALWWKWSMPGWFHVKLTLVVLSIPLGIIGFRRENKGLVLIACIFLLYVLGLALTKQPTLFF